MNDPLWKDQRAETIKTRMQEIYGVGPGIAITVVILLDLLKEITLLSEDEKRGGQSPI